MTADERTPVLVGAGALSHRCDDPKDAPEPLEAMIRVLRLAAEDAGSRELLARADRIAAPRGFWEYPDPCRAAAERFGAPRAKTEILELGVLQTTLLGRAAAAIAAGEADVVLVMAGEARHRAQRAKALGVEAPMTALPPSPADTVLRPHAPILSQTELRAGLAMPVTQYAMIENALRAAEGQSIEKHRDDVARLWAGFARVAAGNPDAWDRRGPDAAAIADPARNPMQAFPYGKLHVSQWNVDQAAGLVFCSVATAKRLGIARDKWVFPLAVADANFMLPLTERREPVRCAGFAISASRALERAGRAVADVAHWELYSCFPVAVRLQMRALGLADDHPVTVTGGMPFAGGPLNHFTLQALVRMVQILRADPGSAGYVSAVSGVCVKQGASVWSSEPGPHGFAFDDVTDETAPATEAVAMSEGAEGEGVVAAYTVLYEGGAPSRTVLVVDLADGRRTLAQTGDPALADVATREELCGRSVRIGPTGVEVSA